MISSPLKGCGPFRHGTEVTAFMRPQTLKYKVVLYLTIALSVAMLLFTGLVAWFLYHEIGRAHV